MVVATVWETLTRLHEGRKPASSATDGRIDSFWDVAQLVFTLFFAFEVMLKVVVFGWVAYWRDFTNRCAAAGAKTNHTCQQVHKTSGSGITMTLGGASMRDYTHLIAGS